MRREEFFIEIIESLKESNEHIPVLVEGRRDMLSLREIGLKCKIIIYNQGKNIGEFVQEISIYKEIIIMIDWDERGKRLFNDLITNMKSMGIKCNVDFRNLIMKILKNNIRSVEELNSYYRRAETELLYGRPRNPAKYGNRRG